MPAFLKERPFECPQVECLNARPQRFSLRACIFLVISSALRNVAPTFITFGRRITPTTYFADRENYAVALNRRKNPDLTDFVPELLLNQPTESLQICIGYR